MTMFKSMHPTARKRIVIKLGGSTLEGLNDTFFSNFKLMQEQGYELIITHGGGPAINAALETQNVSSHTLNGIRVTSEEAIGIVQSTLIGKVNPKLVYELNKAGIPSIGLNGFDQLLIQADYLDLATYGYVGEVKNVNIQLIDNLTSRGIVPVIACIGSGEDGCALNINGDTLASAVALAVNADSLILVTDVSGIRIQDEYQKVATSTQIEKWIEEGHIFGGMIPKVRGAIQGLNAGIPSIQIVNDSLIGTNIIAEEKLNECTF
nr:acetylglutamate kinase [Lysinibacillus timonensis]